MATVGMWDHDVSDYRRMKTKALGILLRGKVRYPRE